MVRRLRYVGVFCSSLCGDGCSGGEFDRLVDDVLLGDTLSSVGDLIPSLVGLAEASRDPSSFARSSHFPRITSRLPVTRCDGAHLRAETADEPVGFDRSSIPMLDWELLRASELPRDDVRSKSRVWYANWPTLPGFEGKFDDVEPVGSMFCQVINPIFEGRVKAEAT